MSTAKQTHTLASLEMGYLLFTQNNQEEPKQGYNFGTAINESNGKDLKF